MSAVLQLIKRIPTFFNQHQQQDGQPSVSRDDRMDWVDRLLGQVTFSPSIQQFRNMTVYPLLGEVPSFDPDYLLLEEALRGDVARISEVSQQGVVPALRLDNLSKSPVLLVNGEEVVGMKQNRVVNLTILVGGH